MPFSSGVFTRLYTWVTEQASPPIEISKLDTQEEDFKTAFNNCLLRDGTGVPTADIPWNSKKITSLADATAATDALNRQSGDARYAQLSGAAFTGTVTLGGSTAGYLEVPQNTQAANYTLVLGDSGKHIYHASGAGAGDTYTIPANSSVAFPVGTAVTFVNLDSNSVSIAITTDTLTLAGGTSTGTRTLAQNGIATAIKVTSTSWLISGLGLT